MLDGILAFLFYDTWIAAIGLLPVSVLYFCQWRTECCRRKEEEFRGQFRDTLQILAASLKVGYAVENAIRATEKDLHALYGEETRIRQEFEQMVHKIDMNRPAEQVLSEFARRVKQEDAEHFAVVFAAAKRMGGDSISILKSTIRMLGEKMEVEREIQTMLAAKQLEFRVMCVIPLGMVLYMRLTFPEFLSVLYGSVAGTVVMSICLCVYIFAYRMGKKMIQIEV